MLHLSRRVLPALALGAAGPAFADLPGPVLRPDPSCLPRGATAATGAVLWVHPARPSGDAAFADAPPFIRRLAGWDLWRLDRPGYPDDALAAGTAALIGSTTGLRRSGYRQIAVVGESRGAFITLLALRQPGLADAVLALAPAAHGTRPERRPQALMDFRAALAAMAAPAPSRAGLVLFRDDPFDPDPAARAAAFRDAMAANQVSTLVIDRPAAPTGHGGAGDPAFDTVFGAAMAALIDTTL